jgi:uncharacterized protein YbjT (DUF2867 family)
MILITGATGNVGSEVLKQAVAAKLNIRATYVSAGKAKEAPATVEIVLMDYTKPATIRAALQGIEKAFLVGPPTPDVAELEGSLVSEAKKTGVKHIVKLSALGGRKAIFPGLHRDSEEKVEASGIPYTFLRPNGFMQNFVNYNSGTITTQNAFYGAQGDGAVSHIDIRDIASVAVKVLSSSGHEGKAYNLTGPEALSNAQVAEKLSRVLGRTIKYVDASPDDFKRGLLSAGVPEWSANALVDLQRLYREGGASLVDPTVEQLTGRKATSFDQFARDYGSAFREEARAAS